MAIRWNDIQAQRRIREQSLSAAPQVVPEPTILNESVSNIVVNDATSSPSWRVVGVSPIAANPVTGIVPEPEPVERFPSRPRDLVSTNFKQTYQNLNTVLDNSIISSFGLTLESGTSTWTTYFPTMESDTQVYTNTNSKPATWDDDLIAGNSTVFATTTPLDGTSYVVGTVVHGREENLQGNPSWSGVIVLREDANTMEVNITSVSSPESINIDSTTQKWYISNDADLLENLF